ncbi:hypothetical protein NQ315_014720 [Exocentrus adspersus]|uniref:DDE Tnp4 domain-containing protein n=1 Tax=Exocentrus adspersus TaxID=1586481 RepID=A0AAV8VE03_9CUCU|nr:hypothetical protein NQ315_014720 [Exocentrus adspersus]
MDQNHNVFEEVMIKHLLLLQCLLLLKKRLVANAAIKKPRRPKRFGVHPIFLLRKSQGFYENLVREARVSDPYIFFNFTRMSPASFDNLLLIVGPYLQRNSMREPISPGCRLAIALRFLATGDSYPSLSYAFRVGLTRDTCVILWNVLQPLVLPMPSTDDLKKISKVFCERWSLPNCVGEIDGKHVNIYSPSHSGSKNFSVILLAVCDGDYLFTYVNIVAYGSQSDGGTYLLLLNYLIVPREKKIPFYFVGNEAFPLKDNLMRLFSKPRTGGMGRSDRIFNYRLCTARRMIENTFGVMVARFRILHRVINAHPTTVDHIMKAIVCLHNFIRKQNNPLYIQEGDTDREINGTVIPGTWRNNIPSDGLALENIPVWLGARNSWFSALDIRNYLKEYVCGPGAFLASWQWDVIDRTN